MFVIWVHFLEKYHVFSVIIFHLFFKNLWNLLPNSNGTSLEEFGLDHDIEVSSRHAARKKHSLLYFLLYNYTPEIFYIRLFREVY